MSESRNPVRQLLRDDPRYRLEAYQFVREALSYAQESLFVDEPGSGKRRPKHKSAEASETEQTEGERHLTGQQLCEAIRQYAIEQFGFMAQVVLKSWGVTSTSDFGEIVYNLIGIGFMKKSDTDQRKDFDDVYDFDEAFRDQFQIVLPE